MDSLVVGTALAGGFGIAFAMQRVALGFFLKAMEASTKTPQSQTAASH